MLSAFKGNENSLWFIPCTALQSVLSEVHKISEKSKPVTVVKSFRKDVNKDFVTLPQC